MRILHTGLLILLLGACTGLWYTSREVIKEQQSLRKALDDIRDDQHQLAELRTHIDFSAETLEVVTKSEMWRPIQEAVKDTVVPVFSQITEFDYLLPFNERPRSLC